MQQVKQAEEREGVNDGDIDKAILSAIGQDWEKAITIVGRIAHLLSVRYATVGARINALVAQGVLVSDQEDLSDAKNFLRARVRKPN